MRRRLMDSCLKKSSRPWRKRRGLDIFRKYLCAGAGKIARCAARWIEANIELGGMEVLRTLIKVIWDGIQAKVRDAFVVLVQDDGWKVHMMFCIF